MCLCQEENWKCFVLLEHLSSYNFVHRATNIKLREKGRNVVGQQLPTMLGVVASVCTSLKVFSVSNTGQQFPTTRNNMQQGMQTDPTCNIQRCRGLFARGFRCLHRVTSHSAADFFYHVQKVHHSMLIIGAKQNWWLLHEWWFENTLSSAWIQLDLFHIFSQHANAPKTLSNNMAYGWFRIEQNQMPPRRDKST